MKNLDGKKIEIKDLLTGANFYRVPEYQRPFSWDEENFDDLIQDLLDAEKNQEYFLGTVVLHDKDGIYNIVDGQQRLTTIMILFACLRDLVDNEEFKTSIQEKIIQKKNVVDGIPEKVRLEVKDSAIFNELVVSLNGTKTKKDIKRLAEPEWRYANAIKVFTEKLNKLTQDRLQEFIKFLSQFCLVIRLSTTSFDDAFKLFTIVNDRGKQLRRIDILKAQNIAPDIIKSDAIRNSLSQKWEDWEKDLGEEVFESVFYLIRFILLAEKPYNDLLVEFEDKIFKKGLLDRGQKFFEVVFDYSSLYNDLLEDFTYFDEHPNRNRIISLLYIMKSEFKSNEWKACLMQYAKKYSDENFEIFLSKLELKYLEGWVFGLNKDARTSIFGSIVKSINISLNSKDVLDSPALRINEADIKGTLGTNLYSRTYCKYILLRLELLATEHDKEQKFEAKSVEHVMPQTFNKDSDWAKWFNEKQKEEWLNKLANLVLLSKNKNSSAKNYSFNDKKVKYLEKRVSDYPRSLQILKYKEWTPEELEKRQKELLNVVLDNIFDV